ADTGGSGASLSAIQPSVRTPTEAVGHRMGILQAEAFQLHNRHSVGTPVFVLIRVGQQVRWIQHPDLPPARDHTGGYIEPRNHIRGSVKSPVTVRVLKDRYLIRTFHPLRGSQRNPVELHTK